MILVTLTSWILFLTCGLALQTSPSLTSHTTEELEECLGQTSTSGSLPVATIEVKSEPLNLSVVVQIASVTVVASPTVQIAWNSSKSDYYQPTTKLLSSNQTSNRTNVSSTKVITSPIMASNPSLSSSSAVSSLIFDHNPSLPLLPASVTNTSAFTSSGSYLTSSDPLFLLLISAIQMGMV